MASFSTSKTSSSITVNISGMDTINFVKQFKFEIKTSNISNYYTSYQTPVGDRQYCYDGTRSYTYSGLNASTEYNIRINIYKLSGNDFIPQDATILTITTNSSGGGGGGGGNDTAVYNVTKSNNSIYISLSNIGNNPQFYSYLFYGPNETGGTYDSNHVYSYYDSYSNIPDGTYYLRILYKDDDINWTLIENEDTGQIETVITIGSGGGGGEDNFIYDTNYVTISSNSYISSTKSFQQLYGQLFIITFPSNGSADIESINNSGGTLDSFLYEGTSNPGYDEYGYPIGFAYMDQSNGNSFSYLNYNVYNNKTYYLWVRNSTVNSGSFQLRITFTSSSPIANNTGKVYIYDYNNGSPRWLLAKPYIYDYNNGNPRWLPASAYVYDSNLGWIKTNSR